MSGIVSRFLKDKAGTTAIEYALIAGLVSVVIIAPGTMAGAELSATFTAIANTLR